MVRRLVLFAFAVTALLACYSGLSGNEPFPCAQDGTCAGGLVCKAGSCTCPLQCGSTCVDPDTDPANCGGCGQTCATSCASQKCELACTLFVASGCPSNNTCAVAFKSADILWGTYCRTLGNVTVGQPCHPKDGVECAPGLECISTGDVSWCRSLCDNNHPCPGGATCNTNQNIPNGGGYCDTPSACGASNLIVQCQSMKTGGGTYSCPANAVCDATPTSNYCNCNVGPGYTCDNVACSSTNPCMDPGWWCD